MTLREAKSRLRVAWDMVLTVTDSCEYRVNFPGGREATAYYGSDLDDAFNTAVDMRLRADGRR